MSRNKTLTKKQRSLIRALKKELRKEARHVDRLFLLELELKQMLRYVETMGFNHRHGTRFEASMNLWTASMYRP